MERLRLHPGLSESDDRARVYPSAIRTSVDMAAGEVSSSPVIKSPKGM
jgi:hypothetical protein